MKKRIFIKNAIVLTITAILLRSAGMGLRIYLSNTVGAEGMGLYQLIFSIYMLAATFATSGLSTAVTRLCADELVCGTDKSVKRVVRRAIELTVLIGAVITAVCFVFAKPISIHLIHDSRAIPAVKILSFSLIFMGISSCLKGYFMARRKAVMPSTAQIFEQIIRVLAVILLIGKFGKDGVESACFAILFADTIAETLSCLYMYICYIIDKRKIDTSKSLNIASKGIFKKLIKISVPIVSGRYLSTILRTIENLSVPNCLQKFSGSKETALSQYGELKGMALPILFFPSSFLMSMSSLLIPEISQANALDRKNEIKLSVSNAVEVTLQMSILISALFSLLSNELGVIIYGSESVGFLMKVLSPLVPVMYLEAVCDGMLKGLNQQNHSLIYSVIDSVMRILFILLLVPKYGMTGFLIMMIVSNLFTSLMNLSRLIKVADIRFNYINWLIKPTAFAVLGCALSNGVLNLFTISMIPRTLISIVIVSLFFLLMIYLTNASQMLGFVIKKLQKNRR